MNDGYGFSEIPIIVRRKFSITVLHYCRGYSLIQRSITVFRAWVQMVLLAWTCDLEKTLQKKTIFVKSQEPGGQNWSWHDQEKTRANRQCFCGRYIKWHRSAWTKCPHEQYLSIEPQNPLLFGYYLFPHLPTVIALPAPSSQCLIQTTMQTKKCTRLKLWIF